MANQKPQMITIDNVEHNLDEMTDEQKLLVQHCQRDTLGTTD
jgi:hypothetical protein